MLIHIPQVLNSHQLTQLHEILVTAKFEDGKSTAPKAAAAGHKKNLQVTVQNEIGNRAWQFLKNILESDNRIFELVHVKKIYPAMFARYEAGMQYGMHVDQPLMGTSDDKIRTDISMTLFLNSSTEYDGGELVIETDYGVSVCKGDAGDLILYPSTMLHEVKPITQGHRLVAIGWMQSYIRDIQKRRVLFDLRTLTNQMENAHQPGAMLAKKTYYNLLRMWMDV